MVTTEEEAAAAALALARWGAEMVATADLAAAVLLPGRHGPSSVALMEEMVDLAAAQASASAPRLIRTALPVTKALSEEVVTAVAVAVEAELSEAPSSMTAVRSIVRNSTFTGNDVDRGEGGVNDTGTDRASKGADAGAAIFSLNGSLILENTTISGNFVTGSDNQAGGGVVVMNSQRKHRSDCLTLSFLETAPMTAY